MMKRRLVEKFKSQRHFVSDNEVSYLKKSRIGFFFGVWVIIIAFNDNNDDYVMYYDARELKLGRPSKHANIEPRWPHPALFILVVVGCESGTREGRPDPDLQRVKDLS